MAERATELRSAWYAASWDAAHVGEAEWLHGETFVQAAVRLREAANAAYAAWRIEAARG